METEQIALFRRLNTVLFDLQGEDMNVAMKDSVNELAVSVSATAAKINAIQTEAVEQGVGYYSYKGNGDNFKIMTTKERDHSTQTQTQTRPQLNGPNVYKRK